MKLSFVSVSFISCAGGIYLLSFAFDRIEYQMKFCSTMCCHAHCSKHIERNKKVIFWFHFIWTIYIVKVCCVAVKRIAWNGKKENCLEPVIMWYRGFALRRKEFHHFSRSQFIFLLLSDNETKVFRVLSARNIFTRIRKCDNSHSRCLYIFCIIPKSNYIWFECQIKWSERATRSE